MLRLPIMRNVEHMCKDKVSRFVILAACTNVFCLPSDEIASQRASSMDRKPETGKQSHCTQAYLHVDGSLDNNEQSACRFECSESTRNTTNNCAATHWIWKQLQSVQTPYRQAPTQESLVHSVELMPLHGERLLD